MMSNDDLDRRLSAWLEDGAAPRAPADLEAAFSEGIVTTRQRPGWATTERWISMETRAQLGLVPRAVVILATLVLLVALAAGAIVVGSDSGPRLPAPFGVAGNGLIAFDSGGDIVVANPDGSGRRTLTTGPATDSAPTWSRDGTHLAFWSDDHASGPSMQLVVMGADGQDATVVAEPDSPIVGGFLTWSQDGSEIAYSAVVPGLGTDPCPASAADGGMCGSRVFVAAVDGSGARQIGDPALDARNPALSPDGHTLAFGGGTEGDLGLYVMAWDGRDVQRLTSPGMSGGGWAFVKQDWSADGTQIATQSSDPGEIYVVEADGTGETNISDDFLDELAVSYAPAGDALSWTRGFNNSNSIVIWTPDPNDQNVVVPNLQFPTWSPDGQALVAAAVTGDTFVVLDRSGKTLAEIDAPGNDSFPSWQRVAS